MEPAFGWTQLSHQDLRRVEDELAEAGRGVRDELGFLELHTLYAERFFPGTSVQLTRLRYCLFVPWIYVDAADERPKNYRRFVANREKALARRLILGVGSEPGVIGRRTYPALPSQPPASTYWNTLGRWGIVRSAVPGERAYPSRGQVERFLSRSTTTSRLKDDDQLSVEPPVHRIFAELPDPPPKWGDDEAPLTFELREAEREYLRAILASVRRADGARSLLGELASEGYQLVDDESLYSERVVALADDADFAALQRANVVAMLSMVGRSLYAAMVETLRDERDGVPTDDVHRAELREQVGLFGDELAAFEPTTIRVDGLVSEDALHLLELVRRFCAAPSDVLAFHSELADIELRRKGWRRARLPDTPAGRERRLEWTPADHGLGRPLHYRWTIVRDLLQDLEGV